MKIKLKIQVALVFLPSTVNAGEYFRIKFLANELFHSFSKFEKKFKPIKRIIQHTDSVKMTAFV